MVWINDGNAQAETVHIEDPVGTNLSYIVGTLNCDARGTSVTTACFFDNANNRVVWEGNISADPGASSEVDADNEVVITFRTTVENNVSEVMNQGIAYWDQDGDGHVDYNRTVTTDDPVTQPDGDPTRARHPLDVPTLSEWGRIVLATLLLFSAYTLFYRRQEEA